MAEDIQLQSVFDTADISKLPDALKKRLNLGKVERVLKEPKALSFLVTGRSGVGKSTLINGLLGMRIEDSEFAKEGDMLDSCTTKLTPHSKRKGRIHVTVWDSRGLLDGSPEKVQDESLKIMVDKCATVDLKLICIEMSTRFVRGRDNPDVLAMIKLTEAFGVDFWRNAMIVLTFANETESRLSRGSTEVQKVEKFNEKYTEWKTRLHTILTDDVQVPKNIVKYVKVVPAGHYETWKLSDRNYWLSDLWFECLDALPTPEAQGAFVSLNIRRFKLSEDVKPGDKFKPIEDQPIIIHPQDKMPTLKEVMKVLSCAAGGAASGAAVGLAGFAAGPLGAAIGIPTGAMMGFCIGLALGVHNIQNDEDKKSK